MSRGEALLAWYDEHHRDLPWRRTTDPYRILVSEVMLQQTQVSRVVPAYEAFLDRFPDEAALAAAPLDRVLGAWQGLGYPVRARRLRDAMRIVVRSGWPATAAELEALPGVGPYTAAAVASFAFGEEIAAVDTNVRRVVSRWAGTPLSGRDLQRAADDAVTAPAATWNQAMMELGAIVCRPEPACGVCPVERWCADPTVYLAPPRQARYEGSLRQVRGDVLRALGDEPLTFAGLAARTGHDPARLEEAVAGLLGDGMVSIADGAVTITR